MRPQTEAPSHHHGPHHGPHHGLGPHHGPGPHPGPHPGPCGGRRHWLGCMVAGLVLVGVIDCCAAATSAKTVAVANTTTKNIATITVCSFIFSYLCYYIYHTT